MPPRFDPTPEEKEKLRRLVEDDAWIYRDIATEMGWPRRRVQKLVLRFGFRMGREKKAVSGKDHPSWRGGRTVDKDGYALVWSPDHPNRRTHTKYVLEHRLVMEQHLGRTLLPEEVVHHKNGNKQDNRIENLALFSENPEHLRHELKGRCPRWTDDGLERLRTGVAKRHSIPKESVRYARPKPGKSRHKPS